MKTSLFFINHHIVCDSCDVAEQNLKIVISIRRLLNVRNSDMLQADGTYKSTWLGYPVPIVGTSDKNNVFHPACLAVCDSESSEDYEFIFRALSLSNVGWQPTTLLADGSEVITIGFERVFGKPVVRLYCFFHVLHNVEKYLKPLTKGGICDHIKIDLNALQSCSNEGKFKKASELFMAKWSKKKDQRIGNFLNLLFLCTVPGKMLQLVRRSSTWSSFNEEWS